MRKLSSADEITFDTQFWSDGCGLFYRYKNLVQGLISFVIFGEATDFLPLTEKAAFVGKRAYVEQVQRAFAHLMTEKF